MLSKPKPSPSLVLQKNNTQTPQGNKADKVLAVPSLLPDVIIEETGK